MRIILLTLALFLTSCYGTYYISDAEYSDVKEKHLDITYYNGNIYWGYLDGWWYYYGVPHQNPWFYYYKVRPPYYYHTNTHIKIRKPKKIIVHRNSSLTSKPFRNNNVLKNNKPNRNIIVKPNRINNNGSKRTNKTTIRKR